MSYEPTRPRGQRRVDGVESPRHRADAATEARRVDGVGRPKFDFHTAPNAMSATRPCATTSKPAARSSATPATAALRDAGVNAWVVPSAAATRRMWERPFFIFLLLLRFRALQRVRAVRWCSEYLLQPLLRCRGRPPAARGVEAPSLALPAGRGQMVDKAKEHRSKPPGYERRGAMRDEQRRARRASAVRH